MSSGIRMLTSEEFYPLWKALEEDMDKLTGEGHLLEPASVRSFGHWLSKYGKGLRIHGIVREAAIATNPSGVGPFADTLVINSLYTVPGSRGMGYATRLVDVAVARAQDEGFGRIRLGTPRLNEGAKRFYLNRGFTIVDGDWSDCYVFEMVVGGGRC